MDSTSQLIRDFHEWKQSILLCKIIDGEVFEVDGNRVSPDRVSANGTNASQPIVKRANVSQHARHDDTSRTS